MRAWLFEHRLLMMSLAFALALAAALTQTHWALAGASWLRPPLLLNSSLVWRRAVLAATALPCLLAFALRSAAEARLRQIVYGQGRVDRLVSDGPFAWLRNPLYLGTGLFFAGAVALWLPPLVTAGLTGLFALFLRAIVQHEENLLATQYGQVYATYRARVRRWLPRPPQPGEAPSSQPQSRAWLWAALGNLGMLSLGLFRLALALELPARVAGALNLLALSAWLVVIGWRRMTALRAQR